MANRVHVCITIVYRLRHQMIEESKAAQLKQLIRNFVVEL